jgi:hypothetical protein
MACVTYGWSLDSGMLLSKRDWVYSMKIVSCKQTQRSLTALGVNSTMMTGTEKLC